MTDQPTVSDQVVDATAAQILVLAVYWNAGDGEWGYLPDEVADHYRDEARRLLAVVEPLIRAQVAEEIARQIKAMATQPADTGDGVYVDPTPGARAAFMAAARVAQDHSKGAER